MEDIRTDTYLKAIISMMVNVVVFGFGTIAILSIPALNDNAKYLLPAWIVLSFVITPFIAWRIAPRMRLRYWRRREAEKMALSAQR
ncbi:hypothetical protein LH464_21710 [Neorhizobium sp. T786]|uniref:hypothetical protein n=1 Tax=Pseudorhizobium xiangyangii TaxID=2883104 RepID=UPI001CFF610A|nr:hypothetical protein [Neorhizobium xiangyangii]MCB5205087.1 hypothetical protein [Neorhizobium xiangyangii]